MSFMGVKYATLSGGSSHTLTIDYCSSSASGTARVRNVRICAIRKAALLTASSAADSTVALTTTLTDCGTLSFTPATAGNYLAIWSAEFSGTTSYTTQVQAKLNGASIDDVAVRVKNNADYVSYFSTTELTCDTTMQTLNIAAAKQSGSTATHNIRRVRLIAIRLADGRFASDAAANSDSEATTTSTTFVNKLTKTWNWGNSGNWLFLTSYRLTSSATNRQVEVRSYLNGATTMGQALRQPTVASGYMTGGSFDVRSVSGSKTVTVDFRTTNGSATAKVKTAHFIAIPLD